jgi:hypothetical protein
MLVAAFHGVERFDPERPLKSPGRVRTLLRKTITFVASPTPSREAA